MVVFPINDQLTIHHPLRGGGVAMADDFNVAQGFVQFTQIGGSQRNVCGGKVFFQAVLLGRAGNRHNPRLLRQHPGQRNLRLGRLVAAGDGIHHFKQFVIKFVVSFYYKLFYLEELNYVFRQVY